MGLQWAVGDLAMRRFILLSLGLLCAIAPAAVPAQGVRGEGVARNSAGQPGQFKMFVTRSAISPVAPYFSFDMLGTTTSTPNVSIRMQRLQSLTVTGRIALFKGSAV